MEVLAETPPSCLKMVQGLLDHVDYETLFIPAQERPNQPYEQLLIAAGEDRQGREFVVQSVLLEELARAEAQAAGFELGPDSAYTLEFKLPLPLEQAPEPPEGMAYLIMLANRYSLLGNFGFSLGEKLYLRYCLVQAVPEPEGTVLVEIIDKLVFMAERYFSLFEAFLQGQLSLEQAEARLLEQNGLTDLPQGSIT